jgi:23S rRNA pseudouridine2605 synthase
MLTNDGDLAQRLMHPRYKVDKEYEVTLDKPWDPSSRRSCSAASCSMVSARS